MTGSTPSTNASAPPSRIRSRLIRGFGASALGPVVTTLVQIISVPVFLHYWGASLYGEWLILSAIPSYLALTDFGFGSVAANDMTMQVGKQDRGGALQTFQSAWLLTTSISLILVSLAAFAAALLPLTRWLHLSLLAGAHLPLILFLLVTYVLLGFQGNMISAGFRCDGNFALGTLCSNFTRLAEVVGVIAVVMMRGTPVGAAAAMLAIRVFGNLALQALLRRKSPWLQYGLSHASWSVVRRLWSPAIAYMAFPAGNALNYQGMLLAVGAMLGPVPVVVFSALRTLARSSTQLTNVIQAAVWPELSRAHGASDHNMARTLHRYSCQASLWISVGAAIPLALLGSRILALWTHGRIAMDTPTYLCLLVVAIINSLWYSSMVALLATNEHGRVAIIYLVAYSISIPVACVLMPFLKLPGAALAIFCTEILCCMYVLPRSLALLDDSFDSFSASLLNIPFFLLERRLQRDL